MSPRPDPSTGSRGRLKRVFERYPFLPALVIFIVLLALNGVFSPASLSARGLTGLLSTYLALMLLAIGQTFVVYASDIDFSNGAILSLVNVVIIVLMEQMGGSGLSVMTALGVGIAVGLACGIVNGIVVAALRLQAVVATFATSIFFTGLALYVLPVAGTPAPRLFWRTYGGRFFEIPFVVFAALGIALVVYLLVRTRLVTRLLAVGDDAQAAYQSGLPVTPIRIGGYALSGVFAALAAFCVNRRHGERRSPRRSQDDALRRCCRRARRHGPFRRVRHGRRLGARRLHHRAHQRAGLFRRHAVRNGRTSSRASSSSSH